jgi:hypothetical protein
VQPALPPPPPLSSPPPPLLLPLPPPSTLVGPELELLLHAAKRAVAITARNEIFFIFSLPRRATIAAEYAE